MAVVAIVAAVIAALFGLGVPQRVATVGTAAVCSLFGGECELALGDGDGAGGDGQGAVAGGPSDGRTFDEVLRHERGEELRAQLADLTHGPLGGGADGRAGAPGGSLGVAPDAVTTFIDGLDADDLAALLAVDPGAVLRLEGIAPERRQAAAVAVAERFGAEPGAVAADGRISTVPVGPSSSPLTAADLRTALEVASSGGPDVVADLFGALGDVGGRGLAVNAPELVGDLGGAPLADRAEANRILVEREIDRLREQVRALDEKREGQNPVRRFFGTVGDNFEDTWRGLTRDEDGRAPRWFEDLDDVLGFPRDPKTDAGTRRELERRIDFLAPYAHGDAPLLRFDPEGSGRIVEVFGTIDELSNARAVGVVTPGVGNDLWNYGEVFRPQTERLVRGLERAEVDDVVYIANVGYDAPRAVLRPSALSSGTTEAGADELVDLVGGLRGQLDAERVVGVGHSLGSVVTGRAARDAGFDAIALLGPPGGRVDHAEELGIGAENVYVAMLDDDELVRFGVTGRRWLHGPPAHDPAFGASRMGTNHHERRHVGYFHPESQTALNLANLVKGDLDEVELHAH